MRVPTAHNQAETLLYGQTIANTKQAMRTVRAINKTRILFAYSFKREFIRMNTSPKSITFFSP